MTFPLSIGSLGYSNPEQSQLFIPNQDRKNRILEFEIVLHNQKLSIQIQSTLQQFRVSKQYGLYLHDLLHEED